jgi:hypothetical protein
MEKDEIDQKAKLLEMGEAIMKGFNIDELTKSIPNKKDSDGDPVNHPPHYTSGGIEVIDYMEAKMTSEQFIGYCLGNVIKYVSRSDKKNNLVEDFKKAQWYLNRLVSFIDKK